MIPNIKHLMDPQAIKKRLIESLKEKGYRLTSQRIEILDFLSKDTTHPGAMTIAKKVREKVPQTSLSTVYYTLDILKKEGLIRELEFYAKDNRYDVNVSNHLNLICTKCGKIEDFMEQLPVSSHTIEKKTGFKPLQMRYEYYGYCNKCKGGKTR
jgi:Fur family transcriptional regulator, peroxide stress response regulator